MSVDRGFTWMDDETLILIGIFSKEEIQQELNGSKRNIGVYERIATELGEVGFMRTAYQCREKIKRLRKEYHLTKYCMENNITAKKPMKYFELVAALFSAESGLHNSGIDFNRNSDSTEEVHFSYTPDQESDASNSLVANESVTQLSILPGNDDDSLEESENQRKDSFSDSQDDDDPLLNENSNYGLSDKESDIDDTESPWVPNVLLVENEPDSQSKTFETDNVYNCSNHEDDEHNSSNETLLKDAEEPLPKRRKKEHTLPWFKKMLDSVTETFLNYQENAESHFMDRVAALEQERMQRDENMQKLWLEFEERRRKEEQQHELKMLSLLNQFIHQTNSCNSS